MDSKPVAYDANKSVAALGNFPVVEFTGDLSQAKCGPGTKCGNFNLSEYNQAIRATQASADQVPGKPENGKPPVKPPIELLHKKDDDGTRPVKPHPIFKDGEMIVSDADKKGLGGKPFKFLKDEKVEGGKDGGKKEIDPKNEKVAGGKDGGKKEVDLDVLKKKLAELSTEKPEVKYTPEQLAAMRAKKEELWREMQASGIRIESTKPVEGGPIVHKPQDSASAHHAATAHRNAHHSSQHRR